MGNSYSNLSLYDEILKKIKRINKQIDGFKKHLENNIKNENEVKKIRVCQLIKNTEYNTEKILNTYNEKINLVNVISKKSIENNKNKYLNKIENLFSKQFDYEDDTKIEFLRKTLILELEMKFKNEKMKDINLNKVLDLEDEKELEENKIIKLRENNIEYFQNKIKKEIKILENANNKLTIETFNDSDNKIKVITENIQNKINFLLENRNKLENELKKFNVDES